MRKQLQAFPVAAIVLAVLLFSTLSRAQTAILTLVSDSNKVHVKKKNAKNWQIASQGLQLDAGDSVRVGVAASARIFYTRGGVKDVTANRKYAIEQRYASDPIRMISPGLMSASCFCEKKNSTPPPSSFCWRKKRSPRTTLFFKKCCKRSSKNLTGRSF